MSARTQHHALACTLASSSYNHHINNPNSYETIPRCS
uniref:Uncharacterized protein n=1 Tax=Arundo donax TaxID=35708 RepID=A0A0A9HQ55_ARUDO